MCYILLSQACERIISSLKYVKLFVTLKLNSMQCNVQTPISIVYDPEILLGFFWSYI